MRKEVIVKEFIDGYERPRRGRREYRMNETGFRHHDKGRGLHILGGRRDGIGPHLEEGCNTEERYYDNNSKILNRNSGIIQKLLRKTKMINSKDELVSFVNEHGEKGQEVEIYKIEENLYKVVYFEQNKKVKEEE